MEESISGSRTNKNLRPTINSYMFGNAKAIASLARLAGRAAVAKEFDQKSVEVETTHESELWDDPGEVFQGAARTASSPAPARKLVSSRGCLNCRMSGGI
jgi:hypothetical protein